jgi:hypothetical protein
MSLDQLLSSPPDQPPSRALRHQHVAPRCRALRWPAQSELRVTGSRPSALRVLISHSRALPKCEDELEDWVREPIDPVELEVRVDRLRRRARLRALRPGASMIPACSGSDRSGSTCLLVQLAVAQLLLARAGRGAASADRSGLPRCRRQRTPGGQRSDQPGPAPAGRAGSGADQRSPGYLLEADQPCPPRSDADQASGTGGSVSSALPQCARRTCSRNKFSQSLSVVSQRRGEGT